LSFRRATKNDATKHFGTWMWTMEVFPTHRFPDSYDILGMKS
jgi:hypothetical protein